jgi:hypothetical protein
MFDLVGNVGGAVSGAGNWVETQWTQRIVQISVCAALLFYVLSAEDLINTVDKYVLNMFSIKLGKGGTRILHAVTFGVFMYIGVRFLLDDLVKRLFGVVEGMVDLDDPTHPDPTLDGHADHADSDDPDDQHDQHDQTY